MSEKIINPELLLQHTVDDKTRKKDNTRKKNNFDDIEDDIEDFDFNKKRKKDQFLTNMV